MEKATARGIYEFKLAGGNDSLAVVTTPDLSAWQAADHGRAEFACLG